jgi:hypothetical protein
MLSRLAIFLAETGSGLQQRFKAWHRGAPRFKVGWRAVRCGGRYGDPRRRKVTPSPRRRA